jgi:hypothetical protein
MLRALLERDFEEGSLLVKFVIVTVNTLFFLVGTIMCGITQVPPCFFCAIQ